MPIASTLQLLLAKVVAVRVLSLLSVWQRYYCYLHLMIAAALSVVAHLLSLAGLRAIQPSLARVVPTLWLQVVFLQVCVGLRQDLAVG